MNDPRRLGMLLIPTIGLWWAYAAFYFAGFSLGGRMVAGMAIVPDVIDDDEVRTGNAMILDPYGRILKETWQAADALVVADLEADLLDRCTGQRWIRGRRPELYGPLVERTGNELDPRAARFSRK